MKFAAERALWTFLIVGPLLAVPPAPAPPTTAPARAGGQATRPAGGATTRPAARNRTTPRNGDAERAATGMSRREWKEQKWKRKVEAGTKREEKVEAHVAE